jgi:ATP-dependent protease ClpP protease subunit
MRNDDEHSNSIIKILGNNENSIKSYKQSIEVNIFHFYITDEIEDPEPYLDLINTLKISEEHDTIYIYLNTPGGSLDTAMQIISSIKQSKAHVITSLEGTCASAGTLIFLSGDSFIINGHSTFMVHGYSHFVGGKGHEVKARVQYTEEFFEQIANDFYKDVLKPEEIQEVLNGVDIWFDSKKLIERLKQSGRIESEEAQVVETTPKKKAKKKTKKKIDNKKKK